MLSLVQEIWEFWTLLLQDNQLQSVLVFHTNSTIALFAWSYRLSTVQNHDIFVEVQKGVQVEIIERQATCDIQEPCGLDLHIDGK